MLVTMVWELFYPKFKTTVKKLYAFLANRSVALNEIIVLQEENFSLL